MIELQNISKQYGSKILFRDASLRIADDSRIAVVGPNGSGKSTLLKIVTGQVEADSGSVHRSRFTNTGYLPQDGIYHRGRTLCEEAERVFQELQSLQARLDSISREIAARSVTEPPGSAPLQKLMRDMEEAQHLLEHRDGYQRETRVRKILFGLGFTEKDLHRRTEEFSGGWHMRIEIAKLLLTEPSVLLLDEPTNHLDIEALQWIEEYLTGYRGALVLVSHDSRFLDNLAGRVVEIALGGLTEYRGNFSSFLKQKTERTRILQATYDNQQRLIERTQRFINKSRADKKRARQVQSRIRMLDKMERITVEEREKTISFSFPESPRAGRVVMSLESITKAYGSEVLFRDLSIQVERGDRIALLGTNGSGKSTLARIMAETEPIQEGSVRRGHNVITAYFAQDVAGDINPDGTVLQTVQECASGISPGGLRSLLGSFLFRDDDMTKPFSVLSGGEKSRLALARMLLRPANFLIMDEPTNHLDRQSKQAVQERLLSFPGSYIIVSHDRDFLAPLINKVFSLKDGKLSVHHGSVDDYLDRMHREASSLLLPEQTQVTSPPTRTDKIKKREEALRRQERYRRLKPLKDSLSTVEREIAEAERRKESIESTFSDRSIYEREDTLRDLHVEHAEVTALLETLYGRWSLLQEQVERIESEEQGETP